MRNHRSEAPATHPGVAGSEVRREPEAAQRTPQENDARGHIRTVLQILALAAEWSRQRKGFLRPGELLLNRLEVTDVENCLNAALAMIAPPPPTDPAQLAALIEDFRPKQLVLLDVAVVPPLCAPAFRPMGATP